MIFDAVKEWCFIRTRILSSPRLPSPFFFLPSSPPSPFFSLLFPSTPSTERTSSVRREIVIHEKENVFTSIGLLIATIKPALRFIFSSSFKFSFSFLFFHFFSFLFPSFLFFFFNFFPSFNPPSFNTKNDNPFNRQDDLFDKLKQVPFSFPFPSPPSHPLFQLSFP